MLPVRPALVCVNPDPATSRLLESAADSWGFTLYNLNGQMLQQAVGQSRAPAVVLVDTTNTNGNTPGLIDGLRSRWPGCPIVAVLDGDCRNPADYCLRTGLYDFVTKPIVPDRLQMTLRRACDHGRLTAAVRGSMSAQSGEAAPAPRPAAPATQRPEVPKFDDVERDLIVHAIRVCRGNVPDIAKCTGISEATIYRKIRKYNLTPLLQRSRGLKTAVAV